MKQGLKILMIVLLTVTSSIFAQNLPKALIIDGDTGVFMSREQLAFADKNIFTVGVLKSKNIALTNFANSLLSNLNLQLTINKKLEDKNNLQSLINEDLKKRHQSEQERCKKDNKELKKGKTKGYITGGVVGIILGLILSIFV